MKPLRIALMIILPLVVLGFGAWSAKTMIDNRPEPEKKVPEVEAPLVRVMDAKSENIRLTVETEGVVAPRTESQLVPEVSGRVLWTSPSLVTGGFFDEGQILLKIDPREYELAVVRSESAIAQAKTRLATEEQEASVARKEWEALGEGEPTPLVLRVPQVNEAKAALASAEAALDQAKFDLERTVVKAPFDGRVREKSVDVGQYVQRGQAVARLYSVDVAEVRLPIADEQLAYINLPLAYRNVAGSQNAQGPTVMLESEFAGETHQWRGRIVRTEGEIDPRTRMIHAIAQVDDPYARNGSSRRPPLAVGMFVKAEIYGKGVKAIAIPRTAIRGENTVLVVNDQDRIEFRQLDIFRQERDRVLARGGVADGERVCVSTLEAAVDGMPVRVLDDKQ
ncbi:MAG: efflux RND transporter periplasmic adaptor subunit [Bryobacterales bacterium]|nr:efflux RND transporter periplasmic adaptor subunit [Bryobacterales bacterium]